MKEIKVEWCENWIKKTFAKLPEGITGVEVNFLFEMAECSGLYVKNTYGGPMSKALINLTSSHYNGSYNFFKLK